MVVVYRKYKPLFMYLGTYQRLHHVRLWVDSS
jgi:hypothetical protein